MEHLIDKYDLAEQIVRAQLERDELDARIAELKRYFRDGETQDLKRPDRPTILVKVSPNTRIDDKLAQENLTPEQYEAVSKRVVDTAKARAFLEDKDLAKIIKHYDNKVEVKLI